MKYVLYSKANNKTVFLSERIGIGMTTTTNASQAIKYTKRSAAENALNNIPLVYKRMNLEVGILTEDYKLDNNVFSKDDHEYSKNMTDIIDFMNTKPKKIKYSKPILYIPESPYESINGYTLNDVNNIDNNNDNTNDNINDQKEQTKLSLAEEQNLISNVINKVKESLTNVPQTLKQCKDILNEELSIVDKIIQGDLMHFAEFNKLNASQGYKFYKILHNFLQQRREIKNLLFVVSSLEQQLDENANILLEQIKKENRIYTPRVLDFLFTTGKDCL